MKEFPDIPPEPTNGEKITSAFSAESGEHVETLRFQAGNYGFSFGHREINPDSKDWFYGGNEQDLRENNALVFDLDSPEFQRVMDTLDAQSLDFRNPSKFVETLDRVIQKTLKSDMADEHVRSLSEMIQTGSSACAGKTLLAGLLIKKLTSLKAEQLDGSIGQVQERMNYPFSHAWLRIASPTDSESGRVILYDPMYRRHQFFAYDKVGFNEMNGGNYNFENYSVSAFPFNVIYAQGLKAKATHGLKLVEEYEGGSHRFFLNPEQNLNSQVAGTIDGEFETEGG